MPDKDLYASLIGFYEFQLGRLPHRDEFKQALQAALTPEDLRVFFLLPFFGMVPIEKIETKAAKAGIPKEELHRTVMRLIPEGLVDSYVGPSGRMVGRAPIIALLEFQVRLKEESPMRTVCVKVMNAFIEGATQAIPTRTPYYRVLPVEATVAPAIPLGIPVADPRQVLPIDVISEMIKREPLIVVADCYCRATKTLIGEDCGHPLETCFYFNELAMLKLESAYARRVDYDEAMRILRDCEQRGLVHNVSNCEGKIQTLCNCCSCSCGVLRARLRGQTNTAAPSRFVVAFDPARCTASAGCKQCVPVCNLHNFSVADGTLSIDLANCIGCGQCVAACPHGALRLVARQRPPKVFRDNDALYRRINTEAMVGLVVRKIRGQ
jgi:electron transport complex protein RnfB